MPRMPLRPRPDLLLGIGWLLAACSNNTGPGTGPGADQFTVDASAAFAYLALGAKADTVTVADPATSTAWDMGFFATSVTLNGGAAGPGGVSGYCVCRHANATTGDLQAFAADATHQRAAFDSITVADIPASTAFQQDALDPSINEWYTGPYGSGSVTPNRAWIVRIGVGASAVLGKFEVLSVANATDSTPGTLAFRFAVEPAAGDPFGADVTDSVDLSSGTPAYYKLTTAGAGSAADWEVKFDHWNIRLDGGVSGPGSVGSVVDTQTPYDSITFAYASPIPPQAFRFDEFSGVFGTSPWYRYNITGTDNQIWPTFDVYLIARGPSVYKVQLLGYYAANGTPRFITVRYAKLR
jgi:hypothetical protein